LKKGNEIVAAVQCWIVKIPIFGWGIAHVKCGPMWQKSDTEKNHEIFRYIVRALKKEYADKRGLLLRVIPNIADGHIESIISILTEEGFTKCKTSPYYRTFIIDLSHSEAELRKALKRRWRTKLKHAEKFPIGVIEGSGKDIFASLIDIYNETRTRKKFKDNLDINDVRRINEQLPDEQKMRILICTFSGEFVGGHLVSSVGKTSVALFNGNTNKGLEIGGSYFLWWHLIKRLKERGYHWFDLGGIDPINCSGTYQFKHGLAGSLGKDVTFDSFDYYLNLPSRLVMLIADRFWKFIKS
jgi:lipid II:glycine glycyltransferase (peptidoglycan interpeptide bridge formation enzyme)